MLAPPFLAALCVTIFSSHESVTFIHVLIGFPVIVIFAYIFGIIPAIIYTVAMEFWFRLGLQARFGLISTVGFSGILGAGAGFLSALLAIWIGFLTHPDDSHLARFGALIGLLIGFYVARKETLAA